MPNDFYLTEDGDLAISSDGDIAITPNTQEQILQQCRMRLATHRGDFTPYPRLGADLQRLVGLPNTPTTARFGRSLIEQSLSYDGFVSKGSIKTDATPTAPDVIEFEVTVPWGLRDYLTLTLTQLLLV